MVVVAIVSKLWCLVQARERGAAPALRVIYLPYVPADIIRTAEGIHVVAIQLGRFSETPTPSWKNRSGD